MKKKVILGAICIAIASIGGVCVNKFYVSKNPKLGLMMENVEALADSEDFVITCSAGHSGLCFRETPILRYCGEYQYYECEFTGCKYDECWEPC